MAPIADDMLPTARQVSTRQLEARNHAATVYVRSLRSGTTYVKIGY